jgi:hypothetical protein
MHHAYVDSMRAAIAAGTPLEGLLEAVLPMAVGVVKNAGVITADDQRTAANYTVVYDRASMPKMLREHGLVPIEAALFVIADVPRLDGDALRAAQADARQIALYNELQLSLPGDPAPPVVRTSAALFAHASQLENDIAHYDEVSANAVPALSTLCVVGRGCWRRVNGTWLASAPDDAVLSFLAALLNTLPLMVARRPPPMGRYLAEG